MAITVGAIRWDAAFAEGGGAQKVVAAALSPAEYQGRAPFWAEQYATNVLRLEATQAHMDAEIAFAAASRLDYWAFLLYDRAIDANAAAMMNGYDLFQASADKSDINWCMIRQSNDWGTTGSYSAKVAEALAQVQQSNYQKVLTNRPLVYILDASAGLSGYWGGSYANFKAAIDAFRAAVQGVGLGNPYIITLSTVSTATAAAEKTGLGADAASMYATTTQITLAQPFSTLRTHVEGQAWPGLLSNATKLAPIIMCGWDRRPRIRRPTYWEASYQRPFFGMNRYTVPPTPSELQAHIEAAIAYIGSNTSACESETMLCYSWNEFDEGGSLCPTIDDPEGDLLAAVQAAFD